MPNPATLSAKEIEGRAFVPVEFRGGVDQESSKFGPPDGTLADCMNYNASARGYERAQGLWHYDGRVDSAPENMCMVWVGQSESTLVGSGFTLGGTAHWGASPDNLTDNSGQIVYWVSGGVSRYALGLHKISGSYPVSGDVITDDETGTTLTLDDPLTYEPCDLVDSRNHATGAYLANTVATFSEFIGTVGFLINYEEAVQSGTPYATYTGRPPGWGPINGGWQFGDEVYVARNCFFFRTETLTREPTIGEEVRVTFDDATTEQAQVLGYQYVEGLTSGNVAIIWLGPHANTTNYRLLSGNIETISESNGTNTFATTTTPGEGQVDPITKSLVWKGTIGGWEWVHTGWTVPFVTGTNAPNVVAAPLFQNDLIDSSRDTGAIAATTAQSVSTFYTGDIAWTNPTNVTADDGSYATCNLAVGERSQAIVASFGSDIVPSTDARIVGIEVRAKIRATGTGSPNELRVHLVSMDGDAADGELVMSDNRSARPILGGTEVEYIYGASDDMWGLPQLTSAEVNAGDVKALFQFVNDSASTGQVEIDYVSIQYYYVPNSEHVYFWNPDYAPTGCEGVLHAYQQFGGEFSIDTAYGEMSFSSIVNPHQVLPGVLMYTEDNAAGTLIAEAQGVAEYNFLPGSVAHDTEDSLYEVVFANFYENDDSAAIYGVTGASSAFTYGSSGFAFIRTPLSEDVDKPRHIAFHDNRLALGFRAGFVALSAVGVPNDFTGVTGSDPSLWGVGDRLTGLRSLAGNVLVVFSESSIRTLEGSGEQSGTMRVVSASAGAKEYTLATIGEPVFADNSGVSTLSTTDKYGDFALGRLTSGIREWASSRVQKEGEITIRNDGPLMALPLRNKNQYRLFYRDGYILVLFFHDDGSVSPTFMHYDSVNRSFGTDYVPTWADSSLLSTGSERAVMGTEDGYVFIIDGANATHLIGSSVAPWCWITTNPINFSESQRLSKTFYAELQGRFFGGQELFVGVDTNYDFNKETSPLGTDQDAIVIAGDLAGAPVFDARSEIVRPYLPTLTDGVSFSFLSLMDYTRPHILQSLLLRASNKGANRNRASKEY